MVIRQMGDQEGRKHVAQKPTHRLQAFVSALWRPDCGGVRLPDEDHPLVSAQIDREMGIAATEGAR